MATRSAISSPAPILAGLALLVSLGHLTWALSTSSEPVRAEATGAGSSAVAASGPSECRCDDASLRSELADLRRELQAMARVRPASGTSSPPRYEPREPTAEELAAAEPGDRAQPPIQMFVDIPAGVKVSQRPDGTISAEATDPERAGDEVLVHALTADGQGRVIRVQVH